MHAVILEAFTALQEGGGYEILRTGDGRSYDFILIPMPSTGFSVPYFKSVLGQAKAYLRPLQKDIVLCNDTCNDDSSKVRDQCFRKLTVQWEAKLTKHS